MVNVGRMPNTRGYVSKLQTVKYGEIFAMARGMKISYIHHHLETAIETIQKHYKNKYNNAVLVPDSVEIMQRHPEIVSALISHLTQDQILDHEKDKWFLDD